jgi:branched-chain amino acid transport system substrate-binding protein
MAAFGLASCTAIVSSSEVQCDVSADCMRRGFPNDAICTEDKVCVGPGVNGCTTNADCIAKNGGKPSVCSRASGTATCVPVLTTECVKTYGPIERDDAIILGSVLSLTGVNASTGVASLNGSLLAQEEIANTVVGLPATESGKPPRPIVIVSCDDKSDDPTAQKAAAHLVDLGAPAIMGPAFSGLCTSVIANVTIPRKTLVISASATSATLSGTSPYFWRTSPSDTIQAIPLEKSINELEDAFKTRYALPPATKIKLAIGYKNDAYGKGLFNTITATLKLNGFPISDASNSVYFKPLQYDGAVVDQTKTVSDIIAFAPSIVALFGTNETVSAIMTKVEAGWPTGGTPPPRPMYLFADGGEVPELLDACKGNDNLRTRIRGSVPGAKSSLFNQFSIRYNGKFGQSADVFGAAGSYDSVYLLAYSIITLGTKPVDGTGVAKGLESMIGGAKLEVGPSNIKAAFAALGAPGGKIDIEGASGPLNFDLAQHEAPSDIDVWCVGKDGANNPTFASSGRFFDSAAGAMVGTYSCP